MEAMDFGMALKLMKEGHRLRRNIWKGTERGSVACMPGYPDGVPCNKTTAKVWGVEEGTRVVIEPYLSITNANGGHEIYIPTMGDLFAEDWYVV